MDARGDHSDLVDAIGAIDPAALGYDEWLAVGMGLHDSGLPLEAWEDWSRRDPRRYVEGECASKWEGFGQGDSAVGSGTIVKMARERGWEPSRGGQGRGRALDWDGEVDLAECGIVDPTWVEPTEIERGAWDPAGDLRRYLESLFDPEDTVGYAMESVERDGKRIPANKGVYTRTAGDILAALAATGDVRAALGDYNVDSGAWFRLNPLDGQGVKNTNVSDFRYALVESDSISKEMQLSLVNALELPCAAVVDSGNKSLHAIVRVDARDRAEYRERVDKLYEVCRRNGLEPDAQNKNPSRLTRVPGVMRGANPQRLVSGPCGRQSWREWWEWVQETTDDMPEPENLASAWDDMPELAPPLIEGVLRQGHKMLMAGPSKAGKSFALIELCIAIAEGGRWMGWRCAQGRVLYVNLELDPASCLHRFRDVYDALGIPAANLSNIDVWNLRGRSVPMDRLAPSLIRRALKTRPIAVVIDPIYKVITGDENAADQMAAFCNQFDKVAQQVGCAVIYCHHHSKGYQGQKRSMDRASGSGVFARDPDALLDMVELEVTDACREEHDRRRCRQAVERALEALMPDWRDVIPMDTQGIAARTMDWVKANRPDILAPLDAAYSAASAKKDGWTAWRIEGTLREFASFPPKSVSFEYPVHLCDETGALGDLEPVGEPQQGWGPRSRSQGRAKGAETMRRRGDKNNEARVAAMRSAMEACAEDGVEPTRANVLERIGEVLGNEVTANTLKNWTVSNAKWSPIRVGEGNVLVDNGSDRGEALDFDGEITIE